MSKVLRLKLIEILHYTQAIKIYCPSLNAINICRPEEMTSFGTRETQLWDERVNGNVV